MFKIRPILFNQETLEKYVKFFSICFPKEKKFSVEYLKWLYFKNPSGNVIGFDAWDGETLAAHYASIPCTMILDNLKEPSIISVNSSTHPNYKRKGLFLQLANATYAEAKAKGFKNAFGISNKDATPGRLKYLGFTKICQLSMKLGISSLNIDMSKLIAEDIFRVHWTRESLKWRVSCPNKKIYTKKAFNFQSFYTKPILMFLTPYSESPFMPMDVILKRNIQYIPLGVKLFVGTLPKSSCRNNLFFDIPSFFRPVPFNFVFKRLDAKKIFPKKDKLFFNFLDFDVF